MGSTNFDNGLVNRAENYDTGALTCPDPTRLHIFFDDFNRYVADEWKITTTEAGAGSATEVLSNADGGVLVITNDAADNDADFFQWVGDTAAAAVKEQWKFVVGKKLWFKTRFKVSDATQSDFVFGLQITDTTPLAVSDGVYFRKDDGDANIDFVVIKDSTATTSTAITTVSDDTYVVLSFYYDGSKFFVYKNETTLLGEVVATNLPDDEELTISFGIQNGEAVAKVLSVDYIFVAKER